MILVRPYLKKINFFFQFKENFSITSRNNFLFYFNYNFYYSAFYFTYSSFLFYLAPGMALKYYLLIIKMKGKIRTKIINNLSYFGKIINHTLANHHQKLQLICPFFKILSFAFWNFYCFGRLDHFYHWFCYI
jgi:hypothetical protein